MAKAGFNKTKVLCTSKFNEETCKVLHLEHSFAWCWTWTLRKVCKKYLESFKTWCWRRIEKISWTDRVRNEEAIQSQGEEEYRTKNKKEG